MAAFLPSGRRIALGTNGRGVLVWETETGHLVGKVRLQAAAACTVLGFQGEKSLFAGPGPTSELYHIDIEGGKVVVHGRIPGMCGIVVLEGRRQLFIGLRTGEIVSCKAGPEVRKALGRSSVER